MNETSHISFRAKLVRLGLWLTIKRRAYLQSLDHVRRNSRTMEFLTPRPARRVTTTTVEIDGVKADQISTPDTLPGRHLIYLHGGAYRLGAPSTYRHFTWRIASAARASVLVVDYRLAPEHPFPAGLDDALSCYRWLLARGGDTRRLAIVGDSAGGGLALALLLKLRDDGVPLPAAAVALSPWTDLALTGASLTANAGKDAMVIPDDIPTYVADYLAGADPRNPYASPLYGNLTGLPPVLIQVSSNEVLRDDAVRVADRLRDAGCEVDLQVWPQMPHVWQMFVPVLPEARRAIAAIGTFLQARVAPPAQD